MPDKAEIEKKIENYKNVITKLDDYYDSAKENIKDAKRETFRSLVENPSAEGPYYKEFIKHKENWFDDSDRMIKAFNNYLGLIKQQRNEADRIKRDLEKELAALEEDG